MPSVSLDDLASRIQSVLDLRSQTAPSIAHLIQLTKRLGDAIGQVDEAIHSLQEEGVFEELREKLSTLGGKYQVALGQLQKELNLLYERSCRKTINICVSGQARVGKSTFLQSVCGLTDREIPTGSGVPVTAVRSRIFHNPNHAFAIVTFHTFDSFRDSVLRPYHEELGLSPAPSALDSFRTYDYPEPARVANTLEHSKLTLLLRLREMQHSLPSYEDLLDSPPRRISLEDLRAYVSYPPPSGENPPRAYLAVKDVQIECPFPYVQVRALGLIDLPGLGELAPEGEERHLQGLQNEVDFVAVLKRPVEGLGFWSQQDGNLANLLDRARASVANRRDFTWIVINTGGVSQHQIKSLLLDITQKANEGVDGKHFRVVQVDVTDPERVAQDVMMPILDHLADRLPVMDRQLAAPLYARIERLVREVRRDLENLSATLKALSGFSAPTEIERLLRQAEELREDFAIEFQGLVEALQPPEQQQMAPAPNVQSSSAAVRRQAGQVARSLDEQYRNALRATQQRLFTWIDQGLGLGTEEWLRNAERRLRVDRYPDKLIVDQIHYLRTMLVRELFALDEVFRASLCEVWNSVGSVFRNRLGTLLTAEEDGLSCLRRLAVLLEEGAEACPTLVQALRQLLNVQVEFRTLIYPHMWGEIQDLLARVKADIDVVAKDSEEPLPQALLRQLQSAGRGLVYHAIKALLQGADLPQRVYVTVLEVFEDQFIRSRESQTEFIRFVRSYRDAIFPNAFEGLNPEHVVLERLKARLMASQRALSDLQAALQPCLETCLQANRSSSHRRPLT